MIFVISGPSGCGKSTLVKRVLAKMKDTDFSVSYTTREKRDGETEGKDYYFVSIDEFKEKIKEEKLIEWALVHGNYYGTSKREVEKKGLRKNILLDIDVQGARQVKERFKKAEFIFILPPVFMELKARLKKRGQDKPAVIEKRLEVAKKEIRDYPRFDYIIINDDLEQAVRELQAILISRNCSLDIRQKEIIPILQSFSRE